MKNVVLLGLAMVKESRKIQCDSFGLATSGSRVIANTQLSTKYI